MAFAAYEYATRCTGAATPGAQALMRVAITHYGARSLGIYNCRTVRGGGARSLHAEGRAGDPGWTPIGGRGNPKGHQFVQDVRPRASQLGVQCLIFDERIWSAKSPGPAGRPYGGPVPHHDHVHFELTRVAGAHLTVATILKVLGTDLGLLQPRPATRKAGSRALRQGASGADVRQLQVLLHLDDVDGQFGPKTRAAVNRLKHTLGLPEDGIVGPRTWAVLLGAKR